MKLGRGVTSTTIKLGINHSAPLGPAFAAVGFAGDPAATDERRIAEILVKYINSHGGLNGRKIIPVYNEYDAVGGGTWDSLAAEACQRFVNDEKVFAVVSGHVGQTDSLLDCLAKGKTPLDPAEPVAVRREVLHRVQELPLPAEPDASGAVRPGVDQGLKDAGYFTPEPSSASCGSTRRCSDGSRRSSKNELKKIGQRSLVEAVLHTPQSVCDFGRMSSEFQSAPC